jgi:hypothetical protein
MTNYPVPPGQLQAYTGYQRREWNLKWQDPSQIPDNSDYTVIGAAVYRSEGTDRGPYTLLTPTPVGGVLYTDAAHPLLINREIVKTGDWVSQGFRNEWIFRTKHPIVRRNNPSQMANRSTDVVVELDGQPITINRVFDREIHLSNKTNYDAIEDIIYPAPDFKNASSITVTYWTANSAPITEFSSKTYYRVTTVAEKDGQLYETPLKYCKPVTPNELEGLNYIWKEAIRRNKWIIQRGERVHLFTRKKYGCKCTCGRPLRDVINQPQPLSTCKTCYGTGIVGGYDGPYPIYLAPDQTDETRERTNFGTVTTFTYNVFTGPEPTITPRDFVVKDDGQRFSVGMSIERPSERGQILQQHFPISLVREDDIRYEVPMVADQNTFMEPLKIRSIENIATGYPKLNRLDPRYQPIPTGTAMYTHQTHTDSVLWSRMGLGKSLTWSNVNGDF